MKKGSVIFSLLALVLAGGLIVSFINKKEDKTSSEEIKWMSYDEATKLTKKHKKKIFIDVYTDWCGWCKKMDATTMKDPRVVAYMNKKFYAVKLNAESPAASNYKGTGVTERELATRIFKANGYPTTLYLDESENLLINLSGYREAGELDKILHFLGEDKYKTQTWEQFAAGYVVD
jgi:thioredoxin-related protein